MQVRHIKAAEERLQAAVDALGEITRRNPPHPDPDINRRHKPDWALRQVVGDIEACRKRLAEIYKERT